MAQHELHGPETARHRDTSALGRLTRTLDRITTVVTADLIVDIGVLVTGIILCLFESGAVARPWEPPEHPQEVVVVRGHE